MSEREELMEIAQEQRLLIDASFGRLQRVIQELKRRDMPSNETSKLDNFVASAAVRTRE